MTVGRIQKVVGGKVDSHQGNCVNRHTSGSRSGAVDGRIENCGLNSGCVPNEGKRGAYKTVREGNSTIADVDESPVD